MRFYTRSNTYKASNLTFCLNTMTGYSYEWYELVKPIAGKLVLNNFNYSATTVRHIYKIRKLLAKLGIQINMEIEAPRGLQDLHLAKKHYESQIIELQNLIKKPKTHKAKNAIRLMIINELTYQISKIEFLIKEQ